MNDDNCCPVACGKCCVKDWTTVEALKKEFPLESLQPRSIQPHCPHLGDDGCKLPRSDRPATCNKFLCDVGGRVFYGQLSLAFAVKYLYECDCDIILFWASYNNGKFDSLLSPDGQARVDKIVKRGKN